MNQKDYKGITKVVKGYIGMTVYNGLCFDLADYFEKEDNLRALPNGIQSSDLKFNREQFLKDCGIK